MRKWWHTSYSCVDDVLLLNFSWKYSLKLQHTFYAVTKSTKKICLEILGAYKKKQLDILVYLTIMCQIVLC